MENRPSKEKRLIRGLALLSGLLIASSLLMGLVGNESANAQSNTKSNAQTTNDQRVSAPLALPGMTPATSAETVAEVVQLAKTTTPSDDHAALVQTSAHATAKTSDTDTIAATIEERETDSPVWNEVIVQKGDTLSAIFDRNYIHSDLDSVLNSTSASTKSGQVSPKKQLTSIRPGEVIKLNIDSDGLQNLEYSIDDSHYLTLTKNSDGFTSAIGEIEYEVLQQHAVGTINGSLFGSASEAGMPDNLIMQLANIFGYDIDFALDIRAGDHYKVIYEERFLDGEKTKVGQILAAEFSNNGNTYQAVRYADPNGEEGYFNPQGRNMKKAFLRTPVNFTRISSRFNLKRKHPILHKIRAHKGVDYAAPRGTPIKAAGKGKIIFRGRKGGYGKVVIIQHGSGKSTLYGHMNNFRKGHKVGSRVKQGETIGYVGSTGQATGPHLHYEFRVNGVHRNPLTVKLPKANPLPSKYMQDFKDKSQPYIAWLGSLNTLALTD